MKMWIYSTVSVLAFAIVVSGQDCSETTVRSRHEDCLNQFINTFYVPSIINSTESTTTCSQAKSDGVNCVNSLLEDCSNQVPQLPQIIPVTTIENAFQYVCDSSYDVALSITCYSTVNTNIASCEETKARELRNQRNIGTNGTIEQLLCLNLVSRSSCLTTGLQTQCPGDRLKFLAFLAMYYPVDCVITNGDTSTNKPDKEASTCSDNVVMTNFTECVKPFFVRIEKLNLDKGKCDESVQETLQCVINLVAKCAQTERFTYIQKLLDLQRTRNALEFACKEDWGLAKGAFCYNKHYGSHIKPCLDKKMRTNEILLGDQERTFESVCKYIDATTDCARSGMETCKDEAVTFSQYVRRFFPDDCTDDSGSAPTQQTLLVLMISLLFANILLW